MKAIINTKLITTEGIIWNGALTFENERIVEVGWRGQVDIPAVSYTHLGEARDGMLWMQCI